MATERPEPPTMPSTRRRRGTGDTADYVAQATTEAVGKSRKYRRQHVALGSEDLDRLQAVQHRLGLNDASALSAAVRFAYTEYEAGALSHTALRDAVVPDRVKKVAFTPSKAALNAWFHFGEPEMLGCLARAGLRVLVHRLG